MEAEFWLVSNTTSSFVTVAGNIFLILPILLTFSLHEFFLFYRLRGNPMCKNTSIQKINHFCDSDTEGNWPTDDSLTSSKACLVSSCPQYYEPIPDATTCFCAAPIRIGYRLKSPSFSYFPPYESAFKSYITDSLNMELNQFFIDSYAWEEGPRLGMDLKLFPNMNALVNSHVFNDSELSSIRHTYTFWQFPGSELFGPYELLNFTLLGPYKSGNIFKTSIIQTILVMFLPTAIADSVLAGEVFFCNIIDF